MGRVHLAMVFSCGECWRSGGFTGMGWDDLVDEGS